MILLNLPVQSFGGRKKQDMVAIFVNKKYIGAYAEFQEYLITHYDFTFDFCFLNYKQLIVTDVQNYYTNDKVNFKNTFPKYIS